MKPHPRIRKAVKWGGAAVCVVLIGAWVVSGWWNLGWGSRRTGVAIEPGRVVVGEVRFWPLPAGTGPFAISNDAWVEMRIRRVILTDYPPLLVRVPIWMLLLPTVLITAAAWRLDTLARRRAATGMCVKCRYDRAGLAAEAVCPECGAAAPSSLPTT